MKRAFFLIVVLASMLAAGLPPVALAQGGPVYITTAQLPRSEETKLPHIDTIGSEVLIASNAENEEVRLWRKADTANSFANPALMGPATGGKPDYNSASVFVSSTGTTYVAWAYHDERRIYLRTKGPGDADFGPRIITFGAGIPYEPEVAAHEDGVFIFWREVGLPIRYRRSTDGTTWNVPIGTLGTVQAEPFLDVAAGAGRKLAVAYYREDSGSNRLQGYLAVWNGSDFVNERIPTVPDRSFANPSVALLPDGGFTVTIRSVEAESGLGAGVYVGDRSAAGSWSSVIRLARGETLAASLDVDPLGNVQIFWISREAGTADLYYTYRRVGEGYGGSPPAATGAAPLRVTTGSSFITNVRAAVSLRDRSYGHAVTERFDGGESTGQYYLFGLPVNIVGAASVSIEGGAPLTSKAAVSVTFAGLSGAPTEVRWAWGAPPAAGVAYSPFNAASPTITVPVPGDANPNCATLTLYTQLKAGAVEQQQPGSDTIILDRAVQAEYFITGPAPALNPGYTSSRSANVFVYSGADCAGIATASVSGPLTGDSLNLPVAGTKLAGQSIELTGDPGVKALGFLASDLAGNVTAGPVTRTITYDPEPPTLRAIGAETANTLVPNPKGTTQLRLALDSFDSVDTGGVVAGIEVVVVGPPTGGPVATSDPVVIPFSAMDQVTTNPDGTFNLRDTLSLADFLAPAELVPGTYTFVIRAVDAAGNVSATSQSLSESLATITFPAWVPFARR